MARAARGTRDRLGVGLGLAITEIVDLAASELSATGGAMGALSYVVLSAISEDLRGRGTGPLTAARLVEMLAVAEDAVSAFGGAKRGDKSLLDPIAYARDAAEEATKSGASAEEALLAAAAAARKGADATATMEACTFGRVAGWVPAVSDLSMPAPQSFAIVLTALSEVYALRGPAN